MNKMMINLSLIALTSPLMAQNVPFYSKPWVFNPKDPKECSELRQHWQAIIDEVNEAHQECLEAKPNGSGNVCSHSQCERLHVTLDELRQEMGEDIRACNEAVREYQEAERERKREENERRNRQREREEHEKSLFEKRLDRHREEGRRLAREHAKKLAEAGSLESQADRLRPRLFSAQPTQKRSELDQLLKSMNRLFGTGSKDKNATLKGDPNRFDFGGSAHQGERTLKVFDVLNTIAGFTPYAAIPFRLVTDAFRTSLNTLDQISYVIENFETTNPEAVDQIFRQFNERVMSPQRLLEVVIGETVERAGFEVLQNSAAKIWNRRKPPKSSKSQRETPDPPDSNASQRHWWPEKTNTRVKDSDWQEGGIHLLPVDEPTRKASQRTASWVAADAGEQVVKVPQITYDHRPGSSYRAIDAKNEKYYAVGHLYEGELALDFRTKGFGERSANLKGTEQFHRLMDYFKNDHIEVIKGNWNTGELETNLKLADQALKAGKSPQDAALSTITGRWVQLYDFKKVEIQHMQFDDAGNLTSMRVKFRRSP